MKKSNLRLKLMCECIWAFSSIKQFHFLPSIFSLFWEENFLVGLNRKYLSPIIYFLSFPSNQMHSKKVFLPIFSPKLSIHRISSPNKHALNVLKSVFIVLFCLFCTVWCFTLLLFFLLQILLLSYFLLFMSI